MTDVLELPAPRFAPPLDPRFRPSALADRAFARAVEESGAGIPLVFSLERTGGSVSRFATTVLPDDHERAAANLAFAERTLKFLLWQRGGWRVHVGGPRAVQEHLAACYRAGGAREFDWQFMGERVYQRPFELIACAADAVPAEREVARPLGRHLDGCRIGFDLGASDRKVSAVVDGEAIYSEEVVWEPRKHADPEYHYREVMTALRTAAAKLPRLDAIGGSSAGVYIDNRPMVASLFRAVPEERWDEVRGMFLRIRDEFGVPLEIVNDGEVTALAGSMSLEDGAVLGVALGSSEAGGYVTPDGKITDWLNELAFCPIDLGPDAAIDEWSGDRGCGATYFSQQCVFRLAPRAGIELPQDGTDAARLKVAQAHLEAGHAGARDIWRSIGVYLGYAIAHYASFYELRHVLILGRCTSGSGGALILDGAREVLGGEFPDLADRIRLRLPDEKSRRVGQSIAAASLPEVHEP